MGGGFLMEFASAVTSVESAIDLPESLRMPESAVPDAPVELGIGIHVGDIGLEDGETFGDGADLAERIEPLASPGGIGISDEAYQQVRQKMDVDWVDGGLHSVKNIDRPVRIWH